MNIKELLESLGITDEAQQEAFTSAVDSYVTESQAEYKKSLDEKNAVELAKKLESLQKKNEKTLKESVDKAVEETTAQLVEYHESELARQLTEVSEQLKVAQDVRNVRSGMMKVMEGLKEAGIETSQLLESVVADEIKALQESLAEKDNLLEESQKATKAAYRAFLVSEATRSMADSQRDSVVDIMAQIDESYTSDQFKKMLDLVIMEKKLVKEEDEDKADADDKAGDDKASDKADDKKEGAKEVDESLKGLFNRGSFF
jgi:hypothetical protein|nr:MAG TPA: hypothetical protein [Caudoviricetes sp.]